MNTVSKAGKDLMIKEPFYGFYLLGLNKRFSESLPTAGVYLQGINIGLDINKEYWYNLSEKHRVGVLKHELLHICFFHLHNRERFPDHQLYNIAADIEINQYVGMDNLPEGCMHLNMFPTIPMEPFKGTQYYYDKLSENMKKPRNPNSALNQLKNKLDGSCSNQCEQGGESQEGEQEGQNKGQGQGQGSPSNNSGNQGSSQSGGYRDEVLDRIYQEEFHITWDQFEGLSDAEKKLIKKQVEYQLTETAKQAKKGRGTIPSELERLINELLTPKPPVFDWKAYMRRFMGTSQEVYTRKSRRKLSKRFVENPGLKLKKRKHILFAVDTSGSMQLPELKEAFSEVYHIWKTGTEVTIIECDAAIGDIYPYKGKFRGKVTGGGGTSFDPVVEYFNKHASKYTSLVYFTDGYAPEPVRPVKPMMWVLSSNSIKETKHLPGITLQIPPSDG